MGNLQKNPNVSVIIATYNRANFIGKAIESVIAQTYTDWELIIVDDASTDTTESVVADFIKKNPRIQYVRQGKNVGISKNRNTGIEKSSGTYIAMLDSDDVWSDRGKLAKQVAFLEENQDHALIGTSVKIIDVKGAIVGHMTFARDDGNIRRRIFLRNQFVQSSVLFSKKSIKEAGLYDPALLVDEDYDLWLKIGTRNKLANLPDFMVNYRIHSGNIIRQKKLLAASTHLNIVKKYRHDYPGFTLAILKSYLRLLRAYFF